MIRCPIVNKDIDIGECASIVYIHDGAIKETALPREVKENENWREICKNCEHHNN